jgi:hypothetical protein
MTRWPTTNNCPAGSRNETALSLSIFAMEFSVL